MQPHPGAADGQRRHVVFAADVAAGADVPAATATPLGHTAADSAEALPASSFTAADSTFQTDSELVTSILRSRPSAVGDAGGLMPGVVEVANPLSRAPSGIPMLRRSGTSLARDGAAFAAIDMPPLSRQASLIGEGAAAAAAAAGHDGSDSVGSRSSSSNGGQAPSQQEADAGSPCFGRMRPAVAIPLLALCLIAAFSIGSAW